MQLCYTYIHANMEKIHLSIASQVLYLDRDPKSFDWNIEGLNLLKLRYEVSQNLCNWQGPEVP